MNKAMRDIAAKIETKNTEARLALDSGDKEAVKAYIAEINTLNEDYDLEKSLFESEQKNAVVETATPIVEKAEKADGFKVLAKMLNKKSLNDVEKSLVYGTSGNPATANDENLLIPEDVRTEITELRRQYISAKDLVTVIPTTSTSGSFVFESAAGTGLVAFDDGGDVSTAEEPAFTSVPWTIALKGKLIKVGRLLAGAEKAGLMAYIDKWFVKNAIVSENADIFTALKASTTPSGLADWEALKASINTGLDPSSLIGGVIVTNQSGFNALDKAVDGLGRPVLNPDPKNSSIQTFCGLPITVFADAQLANLDASYAPIFYGNLKDGCYFIEKDGLEFAVSEHFYFGSNSNALRVVEGYDAVQADGAAYKYEKIAI